MITPRDIRYYNLALKIAYLSECNYKHGAIIVAGSRIISVATNKLRTHPVTQKWRGHMSTCHAEQRAIALSRCDVTGMTLYSARAGKSKISKLCPMCSFLCQEAGIARIVYSDGYELIKERL